MKNATTDVPVTTWLIIVLESVLLLTPLTCKNVTIITWTSYGSTKKADISNILDLYTLIS